MTFFGYIFAICGWNIIGITKANQDTRSQGRETGKIIKRLQELYKIVELKESDVEMALPRR